jgi:hypothetical protein
MTRRLRRTLLNLLFFFSLSLSLSDTHTHTHTQSLSVNPTTVNPPTVRFTLELPKPYKDTNPEEDKHNTSRNVADTSISCAVYLVNPKP